MTAESTSEDRLAKLMRAAIAGDDAAYAAFLRHAAELVRRLALRKVDAASSIGPEDIVQETLLAVHLKRHTWRQSEPVLPWLMSIARYKTVDAFRRRGRRISIPIDELADILAAPPAEAEIDESKHIERAVAVLSVGQQKVVRSIALDGRSIRETATALDMKETAVRVAFHRGLTSIAAKLGRQS